MKMTKPHSDPLYSIFERHLFNALVENESADEFLARVVQDYLELLIASGTILPQEHRESVESDLRDEVLEMLRKKTYGHYSLAEFRKAHAVAVAAAGKNEKARRGRRAS